MARPLIGTPRRRVDGSGEAGLALLAVLILGTAVALMAHASLMIGLAMDRSADVAARAVELDVRFATLLRRTASDLVTLDDPIPAPLVARRLSPELLRLQVDSGGRGWAGLVWAMDPQVRLDALIASVQVGAPISDASLDGLVWPSSDLCPPDLTPPPPSPAPYVTSWDREGPLDFGPLALSAWQPLPEPGPVGSGGTTAMFAEESLSLGPGRWTGLLLVDGSLELRAGAVVSGWVAVRGDLRIRNGAEIEGVVRAGGRLDIEAGGQLSPDPCMAVRRLATLPVVSSPSLVGESIWPTDPVS